MITWSPRAEFYTRRFVPSLKHIHTFIHVNSFVSAAWRRMTDGRTSLSLGIARRLFRAAFQRHHETLYCSILSPRYPPYPEISLPSRVSGFINPPLNSSPDILERHTLNNRDALWAGVSDSRQKCAALVVSCDGFTFSDVQFGSL